MIIVMVFEVMPAVFTPDVMAMDKGMMVVRPMAGHPVHLVVPRPVMGTMAVVWPVTDFNSNSLRLDGAPESEARNGDRHE